MNTDKLISYEPVGGWPIYKLDFLTILKDLGACDDGEYIKFRKDNPLLKLCPCRLIDDGMGYGIEEQWITEVNTDRETYINVFTEPELSETKLDEYVKAMVAETEKLMDTAD